MRRYSHVAINIFWGNYRSTVVSIFKIITDLPVVSIFKIITDLPVVSILRLFLRVHSTGTTFVIYLEIDTTVER
jgi:hypothetical protein